MRILLPQFGHLAGESLVDGLRRGHGRDVIALILPEAVAARSEFACCVQCQRSAFRLELDDLLFGRRLLAIELLHAAVVGGDEPFASPPWPDRVESSSLSLASFQFLCVAYTAIDSPINTRLMIKMTTTKTLPSQFMV